ncbi:MAG: CRISPR-associated ring nuclease [Candidatus Competibacter sp.]|nr:hypothetical protein [Candidatus Competibacter sp.]
MEMTPWRPKFPAGTPVRDPAASSPALLLCTLGVSWAVVPEIFGFLAPERFDLYRDHPQRETLREAINDLPRPDAIWLVTTSAPETTQSLEKLAAWRDQLAAPPTLRVWRAGAPRPADEVAAMRELILRAVLAASEQVSPERLLLSLAGGRKTMSADLQRAGSLFGCRAMLHVIDVAPLPAALSKPEPAQLAAPLTAEASAALQPRLLGRRSIGVGGHIEEADHDADLLSTARACAGRELAEQLVQPEAARLDPQPRGWIHERETAIGRVHLGLVFTALWSAPEPPQPQPGEPLLALGFLSPAAVRADARFERWSQLAVELMATPP